MNEKSIGMLKGIRIFCVSGTFCVIVLAVVSLWVHNDTLRDTALVLSVLGTVVVTFLTAKVINAERER